MNIEFHYYMIYYLAKKAGFSSDDAYVIAYSSQHTDDNRTRYKVKIDDENTYSNYMSQTMNIKKPMETLMRVYLCFHFLPGDYETSSAYRRDGKLHLLNTTPNSENAKKIMNETMALNCLYRLGISLHVLADTWSHQNFIGCKDYVNADYAIAIKKLIPNIGHADFLHQPDEVALKWSDNRLIPSHAEVRNKKRMLVACKECFSWLIKYKDKDVTPVDIDNKWADIFVELSDAMGDEYEGCDHHKDRRISKYKKLIGDSFKEYEDEGWFNESISTKKKFRIFPFPRKVREYSFKKDYSKKHWYKYQESVKKHQTYVRTILDEKLEKMEILNF